MHTSRRSLPPELEARRENERDLNDRPPSFVNKDDRAYRIGGEVGRKVAKRSDTGRSPIPSVGCLASEERQESIHFIDPSVTRGVWTGISSVKDSAP